MQPLTADDPRSVGGYRLLGRLGAGGMGRVYLGRSAGGRTVAVKVVHPYIAVNDDFRARFRREVDSARRVGGDWTAPVLAADPDAEVPWVSSGYVAGPSLQQAVEHHGALPERTVRALGAGLAEALGAVHALALVHRDVKPSNVLLALDGPRLIDFGIARATDGTTSLTSTGVALGSPGFMSPEQVLAREIGPASDVFLLGAVLAYAATGQGPFPGDSSASLLYKVVHEEPELPGLTGELRELCAGCLAKDPAARPTPMTVARRLAGDVGAAGLLGAGWLPGPVLEAVSRRAVELLDLELDPDQPLPVPTPSPAPSSIRRPAAYPEPGDDAEDLADVAASGPIPFTTPSEPAAWPLDAGSPPGAFGPPDPSFGPSAARAVDDHPGPPRGRWAVRAGGAVTRSGAGERRLSCTVVLAVAGALAVTTTAVTVFTVLPGGSEQHDSAQPNGSAAASDGTHSDHSSGSDDTREAVPRDFLGTWRGEITIRSGLPAGRVSVRITQGARGEDVAKLSYTAPGEVMCYGAGRLLSVTPSRLVVEERTDSDRGGSTLFCSEETAKVTLTLRGKATLRYASADQGAGEPAGHLTRSAR